MLKRDLNYDAAVKEAKAIIAASDYPNEAARWRLGELAARLDWRRSNWRYGEDIRHLAHDTGLPVTFLSRARDTANAWPTVAGRPGFSVAQALAAYGKTKDEAGIRKDDPALRYALVARAPHLTFREAKALARQWRAAHRN
jgi:hypothetical protein